MLKESMEQFVCVRLVRAETLDLSLFKFDPDLSFAVFFLNADKTVYGRYGTRSDFYEAEREVSLEGLQKAMKTALAWHKISAAEHKELFQAKRGPEPKYKTLAEYPSSRVRSGRGRGGRGGGRCTHCHDLRTAEQMAYRSAGEPMPENVLFSWPLPDAIGLRLDPKEMAKVEKIWERSPAKKAGLKAGDEIVKLGGQPILSIADVQWVLQNAGNEDDLVAEIKRNGEDIKIEMHLDAGWRRYVDISWRTTTGVLRRNMMNGIEYRDLAAEDREKHGLAKHVVALKVARGASRDTGDVRRDDIVVGVDGKTGYMSEGDLMAYFAQDKKNGDEVTFTVLRNGKTVETTFPIK